MVEANPTISQSLRFRMSGAVMTLAQREAEKAIKRAIRDKGIRKVSSMKRSEIAALGREYLAQHAGVDRNGPADHRSLAGVGFFGKRAARTGHIPFQSANTSLINAEVSQ
jgi:hypothetical protein